MTTFLMTCPSMTISLRYFEPDAVGGARNRPGNCTQATDANGEADACAAHGVRVKLGCRA